MTDDGLRRLIEGAVAGVSVPAGDVAAVMRSGRRRRTYAVALGTAATALVVAGAWTALESAYRPSPPEDVAPVGPDRTRTYTLVPVELDGPEPPALARRRDVEDARAVAVAFHALLHRVGYDLDYKNVVRSPRGWQVTFVEPSDHVGTEPAELQVHMETVLATRARVAERIDRLVEIKRELEADARAGSKRARRSAARVHQKSDALRKLARELAADVRVFEERLRAQPGPARRLVVLHVGRSGGELVVEDVDPARGRFGHVVGYAEAVEDVDVFGVDYYDGRFQGPGEVDDVPGFEMRGFWTGPIPSAYQERCIATLVEHRGGGGEVWRQARYGLYRGSPATEDERDGWTVAFGIDHEGSTSDVDPLLRCSWRRAP